MSCYTLSSCILENLETSKKYTTDLLFVFTNSFNPFKVSLDKTDRIMDIYEMIAQNNSMVAYWLDIMGRDPSNFEIINIDTNSAKNNEELFLMVASSTKSQQKIFVHSHEMWQCFSYMPQQLKQPKVINYNQIIVSVYDRDEAILELNQNNSSCNIYATNSVVSSGNSTISNTENRQEN